MTSPNSGHTAANIPSGVDGLRDGDVITSPSLTNFVEGIHGNGILRLQDGAYDMVGRTSPTGDSPGSITTTGNNIITVQGGYAVLDGVLYSFGGGPGNDKPITIDNTLAHSDGTVLAAGQEVVYVVYLCASSNAAHTDMRIRVMGGTPVATTGNVYPPIPEAFLLTPNTVLGAGELNGNAIALATLRATQNAAGGTDQIAIQEVNDKRVFVHSTARYFTPLNRNIAPATPSANQSIDRKYNSGVNSDAHLKTLFANTDEDGDFGGQHGANRIDVSALWVSHQNYDTPSTSAPGANDADYGLGIAGGIDPLGFTPTDVLYFSGQGNSNQALDTGGGMYSVRLGSRGVDVGTITVGGTVAWPITSYGDSTFIINVGGGTVNLVPTGTFPEGHTIEVKKSGGGGTLQFNGGGVTAYERWIWDGAAWQQLI